MSDPLDDVQSEAIRWIVDEARAEGCEVAEVADWTEARVVHMRAGLSPGLRSRIEARWPDLRYYAEPGSPHTLPDEGYADGRFHISFPTDR